MQDLNWLFTSLELMVIVPSGVVVEILSGCCHLGVPGFTEAYNHAIPIVRYLILPTCHLILNG